MDDNFSRQKKMCGQHERKKTNCIIASVLVKNINVIDFWERKSTLKTKFWNKKCEFFDDDKETVSLEAT